MSYTKIEFDYDSSEDSPLPEPEIASKKRTRETFEDSDEVVIIQRRKRARKPTQRIKSSSLQSRGERVYGGIDFDHYEIDRCNNCNTVIGNISGTTMIFCDDCQSIPEIREMFKLSKKLERKSLKIEKYDFSDDFLSSDDDPIIYESEDNLEDEEESTESEDDSEDDEEETESDDEALTETESDDEETESDDDETESDDEETESDD